LRYDAMHGREGLQIEVMAPEREHATEFIDRLLVLMNERNVYRGRVLALGRGQFGDTPIEVRALPAVRREDIVLPDGVLERVERQTIEFDQHVDQLRERGLHLKRGLLLHGPPGTGKTLCAMYLASQMPHRTTLVLTGQGLGAIAASCEMARRLQPATVVLDDVDLVAMDRSMSANMNALLFELLNQMEGLQSDTDVIFVLTTNRSDILEPALAQRPGRIDEAVELPLPDETGRARLFDLYGTAAGLSVNSDSGVVERTAGVSPAFIRELVRRAVLIAAMEDSDSEPDVGHLETALNELEQAHASVTRKLLGSSENTT
jgi:ATP-dependent 26S proteasome regulatory subunit